MHRAGPLHKEGLKLNEPLWDVRVEEDDIFLYFLWEVGSIWIKNKTKKLSTGQKEKKATFTNALLIPRWLRSPVSNLLPHFLCYEMLGIVLSWLSCISIESRVWMKDTVNTALFCPLRVSADFFGWVCVSQKRVKVGLSKPWRCILF